MGGGNKKHQTIIWKVLDSTPNYKYGSNYNKQLKFNFTANLHVNTQLLLHCLVSYLQKKPRMECITTKFSELYTVKADSDILCKRSGLNAKGTSNPPDGAIYQVSISRVC